MNTIKLILKGILFYTTLIVCMLSIAILDSIYDTNYIFIDIVLCIILIFTCIKCISEDDLYKITLSNWIEDKLNSK